MSFLILQQLQALVKNNVLDFQTELTLLDYLGKLHSSSRRFYRKINRAAKPQSNCLIRCIHLPSLLSHFIPQLAEDISKGPSYIKI